VPGLLPPALAPLSVERAVHSSRARGTPAVLRLALARPPVFAGREQEPVERAVGFLGAASMLALERAADCLKYGTLPAEPWIEVRVPSRADPALAPEGKAVALVACHTVPHALAGGWNAARRAELERALLAALESLAPGTGASVLASELLTPVDIEARHGTPGGHPYDGEIALDQLWLQRPSLALGRYATPIRGLWLGGAGAHPGGPFLGGAGVLSARALLDH
jgi:phytoene dehydrogenase-like protein